MKYIRTFQSKGDLINIYGTNEYVNPNVYLVNNDIQYDNGDYLTVVFNTNGEQGNTDIWKKYPGDIYDEILVDSVKWNDPMTPLNTNDINDSNDHILKIKFKNKKVIGGNNSPVLYNKYIKKINIPNTFNTIEGISLCNCGGSGIDINIPDSITSIGTNALGGSNIKSITLGKFFENHTLNNAAGVAINNNITHIYLSNSITVIPNGAFAGFSNLSDISISKFITSIGDTAFQGCTGLTSIILPDTLTSIGFAAFGSCTGLTNLIISNSLTSIGNNAFTGCTGLTSIILPDTLTSIGTAAFSGCTGLTNLIISNSLTSINTGVFAGCSNLTSIIIPESVTSIGKHAFKRCSSLINIIIPNSVISIDDESFIGCTSLSEESKNKILSINPNCIFEETE
jgi:hypothetical protein